MPYYSSIGKSPSSTRKLRTIPLMTSLDLMSQGSTAEQALSLAPTDPKVVTTLDDLSAVFVQNSLSKQATECHRARGCDATSDDRFATYTIHRDQAPVFSGTYSTMFKCDGPSNGETSPHLPLVCRIFQPSSLIDPKSDPYVKILRHLSSQCRFVLATVDMFVEQSTGLIYMFMEWADAGNAWDYLRLKGALSERQMCSWAHDLYSAMDFLGTKAIAHRAIYPKHLLLRSTPDSDRLEVKLGGLRDAIVYWDPDTKSVIYQRCKTLNEATSFHAPEMFGSVGGEEYYDPVDADIWSYGCTLYFCLSRKYPLIVSEDNLETVIRNAIAALKITDSAKYWLFGLLRTNTAERTDFGQINTDDWFESCMFQPQ